MDSRSITRRSGLDGTGAEKVLSASAGGTTVQRIESVEIRSNGYSSDSRVVTISTFDISYTA